MKEAKYKPFPSFAEWQGIEVDATKWQAVIESSQRWRSQPEIISKAVEWVKQRTRLQSTELSSIYDLPPSLAMAVVMDLDLVEDVAELNQGLISSIDDLIKAQAAVYESLVDFADDERPLTQTGIRGLHALICIAQERYNAQTIAGGQRVPIPKGVYKQSSNNVVQQDGTIYAYAPVDETPHEMARLCGEILSDAFIKAHPILQAAYIHHAFISIHPFADGNGRTARGLSSIYLYRACGLPLLFSAEHKTDYLKALRDADRADFSRIVRFMLERTADSARLMDQIVSIVIQPSVDSIRSGLADLLQRAKSYGKSDIRVAASRVGELFADLLEKSVKDMAEAIGGKYLMLRNPVHRGVLLSGNDHLTRYLSDVRRDLRVIEFTITALKPVYASLIYQTLQVEIPIHCSAEDEIVITKSGKGEVVLALRVADALPAISQNAETIIQMAVDKISREVGAEVHRALSDVLKKEGYLDS